jgi:hypothetical protein
MQALCKNKALGEEISKEKRKTNRKLRIERKTTENKRNVLDDCCKNQLF